MPYYHDRKAEKMVKAMEDAGVLADNMTGERRAFFVDWLAKMLKIEYETAMIVEQMNALARELRG